MSGVMNSVMVTGFQLKLSNVLLPDRVKFSVEDPVKSGAVVKLAVYRSSD